MDIFGVILAFIFGTIIGSFLNVVSLRFNTGMTVGGRSRCMTCGKQLTWKELVPIVSYLIQRGSCKGCKSKISKQYPLVEFFAGVVFVLIFFTFPPFTAVMAVKTTLYLIATCLLLVISVYDSKHKIIPDNFVFAFAAVAVVSMFIGGDSWFYMPSIWAILAGPILALPFALLWAVSRGRWMGFGDAKLALGIGWLLGIGGGINAMVLAFWIAAVVSVVWLLLAYGRIKPRTEIPFGPFMIIGMYLVLFFGIQVIDINTIAYLWLTTPSMFGV